MSWNTSLPEPVPIAEANAAIDALQIPSWLAGMPTAARARQQLEMLKPLIKAMVAELDGPFVTVSASGHVSAPGTSGSSLTISVSESAP